MSGTQLTVTNKTVEDLTRQLEIKREKGLIFPKGYSLQNAMNSAYLMRKRQRIRTVIKNMDNPILAAYAIIKTENETVVEIMTKKQLENS